MMIISSPEPHRASRLSDGFDMTGELNTSAVDPNSFRNRFTGPNSE